MTIMIPTFHHKPLRMAQPTTTASQPITRDSPFLYYSISTNAVGGHHYVIEDSDDNSTASHTSHERIRFPVEVHPMQFGMLETLFTDMQ